MDSLMLAKRRETERHDMESRAAARPPTVSAESGTGGSVREDSRVTPVRYESVKLSKLLAPFEKGRDIGLYLNLVNFKRTCARLNVERESWVSQLLGLLPTESAEVIALYIINYIYIPKSKKCFSKSTSSLYTEALRRKFRNAKRQTGEVFSYLAYNNLASFMNEWLTANKAETLDQVKQIFALEQFYRIVPEMVRIWLLMMVSRWPETQIWPTNSLLVETCGRQIYHVGLINGRSLLTEYTALTCGHGEV